MSTLPGIDPEEAPSSARRSSPVALAERLCNLSVGELHELAQAVLDRPEGPVAFAAIERAIALARGAPPAYSFRGLQIPYEENLEVPRQTTGSGSRRRLIPPYAGEELEE